MPELPAARRARYRAELGLTAADAGVLTSHPVLSALFEDTTAALIEASGGKLAADKAGKRVGNFIQAEVMREVSLDGLQATLPVQAAPLSELLALVEDGSISGKMAKGVLADMIETGKAPKTIVEEKGLSQVSDSSVIERAVREVIEGSPDNVAAYRGGKKNVLGWFVGQVMKATKGQANPKLVNEALRNILDGES